jgi:hypothetical protein
MPELRFRIEVGPELLDGLLDLLAGGVPAGGQAPGDGPVCSVEIVAGGETWTRQGGCDAPPFGDLAGMLHPSYFTARHLLEAGMDAESKLDARDVYGYYADGLAALGGGYGGGTVDLTVEQAASAARAHDEGRFVDAVVLGRNALASRLMLYGRNRLEGLSVED